MTKLQKILVTQIEHSTHRKKNRKRTLELKEMENNLFFYMHVTVLYDTSKIKQIWLVIKPRRITKVSFLK